MTTLKNIINNNGATLDNNFNMVEYKKGYQVSTQDIEVIPLYKLTKKHLLTLLKNNKNLGVWIENKKVYIDYSVNIKTKKQALQVGKKLNQISIYDWKNQKVVYC